MAKINYGKKTAGNTVKLNTTSKPVGGIFGNKKNNKRIGTGKRYPTDPVSLSKMKPSGKGVRQNRPVPLGEKEKLYLENKRKKIANEKELQEAKKD